VREQGIATASATLIAAAIAMLGAGCGEATLGRAAPAAESSVRTATTAVHPATTGSSTTPSSTPSSTTAPAPARPRQRAKPGPPFALGQRVVTFVDHSRTVRYPGRGPGPRRLVTIIRYPLAPGPFPLIVFGHGFAVTPGIYSSLLSYWARRGYVVAAPVFPLGNANAPGGPDERDLINQPGDISFVISQLVAAGRRRGGFLAGHIAAREIAVAGQSDGGDTALSAAYDVHFRDRRIRAAVILSGAEIPGEGGYDFPAPSPPLLATQGLADTINPPSLTYTFFDAAPQPKFLLTLPGAPHLGPYTDEEPQLGIVERVSTEFLDLYLKGYRRARARMFRAGNVPGVARLS
jgi:dienelactone hydrolase